MNKILIIIFILLCVNLSLCQTSVTFQLDLTDLNEKGYFSYESGDKVFIRGTFNNWQGTEYELSKSTDSNIFSGKFFVGNMGDTISYKYVIKRSMNHFYWESQPNLNNPDGNRLLILKSDSIVLSPVYFSYDEYIDYPVIFSKAKLKEDFLQFRNILESTHPALYDYTSKKDLDSIFDVNYSKIDKDLDFNTFLMLMTDVISKVGCGHTSLWIPNKYWDIAPKKLFPVKLLKSGNKIYTSGSYSNSINIPLGSEIIAVNGQKIEKIINHLASLTSADGFNPSYKNTKAVLNFSEKYALAYGFPDDFIIDYKIVGSDEILRKVIQPVSKGAVDKNKPILNELSFKIDAGTNAGVLTINTFGYYSNVEMFHNFIDSVFTEIDIKMVTNLILDLRGNSGGDPFCSSYLWGYLQPKSLPYFEGHYGKYDTLANPIPLPNHNYKGKLFTLIDGNGFSTTGHFCGLLKFHKVGQFIGTELGSTFTCTGNAIYPPLKNTGIMVGTARVRRYTAAVKSMDPKRGVTPDHYIELTQEDIIEGKDPVMEYAKSLAKSK